MPGPEEFKTYKQNAWHGQSFSAADADIQYSFEDKAIAIMTIAHIIAATMAFLLAVSITGSILMIAATNSACHDYLLVMITIIDVFLMVVFLTMLVHVAGGCYCDIASDMF